MAHYPPDASQDNPIEPRWLCQITRVGQGVILTSLERVRERMNPTTTTTGLQVLTTILAPAFPTGRQVTKDLKRNIPLHGDDGLPQWNDVAKPSTTGVGEVIKS